MPGSGKSYFGAVAAQKLNRTFVDTDELIMLEYFQVNRVHATCREITLKEGAPFFRDLEKKVIKELENIDNAIIAIGGSTLCSPENVQILKKLGRIIYLDVHSQVLLKRLIARSTLPSYLDRTDIQGSFESLLKQRIPLYEENCDCRVDVSSGNVLDIIGSYAREESSHGK